ncbi:hypothetical protein BC938DRAFT_474542 [Jimgerdemannia flammicorona]|uniref:Uncharacterized protein n=1 Tax=Jimgerdemannia flammicorona TaxID=994334 RepID=A0A433QSG0_9FUNG|nr:hypothetical protein BC938DRAFT_474542 [Jimgerdemannia flammicorona]
MHIHKEFLYSSVTCSHVHFYTEVITAEVLTPNSPPRRISSATAFLPSSATASTRTISTTLSN